MSTQDPKKINIGSAEDQPAVAEQAENDSLLNDEVLRKVSGGLSQRSTAPDSMPTVFNHKHKKD